MKHDQSRAVDKYVLRDTWTDGEVSVELARGFILSSVVAQIFSIPDFRGKLLCVWCVVAVSLGVCFSGARLLDPHHHQGKELLCRTIKKSEWEKPANGWSFLKPT